MMKSTLFAAGKLASPLFSRQSSTVAQVTLIGYSGKTIRKAPNNEAASFGLVTEDFKRAQDGTITKVPVWHNINVYGSHNVEAVSKMIKGGNMLMVQGKLQYQYDESEAAPASEGGAPAPRTLKRVKISVKSSHEVTLLRTREELARPEAQEGGSSNAEGSNANANASNGSPSYQAGEQ